MEESELVELAKAGDRKALAQLVKDNEQTVYNFSFKICRDRDKAEHIMQETFYSMIKSLHQFDGNSKLSTWLYRIVSNHCLMLARKEKNRTFVSIDNDLELDYKMQKIFDSLSDNRPILVDVKIDYTKKTFMTKGVVKTNLSRFPLSEKIRFISRSIKRHVLG